MERTRDIMTATDDRRFNAYLGRDMYYTVRQAPFEGR